MPSPRPRTGPNPEGPRSDGEPRYVFLRELGSGALGRVDLVRDRRGDAVYARKSVGLSDEEAFGILEREYRIRTRLAHPQVPRAHHLGHDAEAGTAYLILEYVQGLGLAPALVKLGADSAPLLLAQALNAISWLHQRGVLHCDIKPENLCVGGLHPGSRPLLRLLDFGTAVDSTLKEKEWRGGTLAYVAPYLRESGQPDAQADLYALGRSFVDAFEQKPKALAVPEALLPVLERLGHADHDFAFGSADEALAELIDRCPEIAAAELPFPSDAPFVGREVERSSLGLRLEELKSGILRRNLMVLRGAAGLGKSRILREFERDAMLAGVDVVRMRCRRAAGALEPVLELVSRILPADHPEHERLARAVAPVVLDRPSIAEPNGRISMRYLRDLAGTVRSHAAEHPLVFLLDDAELADESTLGFLRLFSRIGASGGPFVVAGFGEARAGTAELSDLVEPGENSLVLELEPLPTSDLRQLVTTFLPARIAAEAPLEEWVTWSEGNPRLALALAEAFEAEVAPVSRGAASPDHGALYRGLMEKRLARIDDAGRRLLTVLSILERATPVSLLHELCDLADEELQFALEQLLATGMVESEAHWSGRRYQVGSRILRRYMVLELSAEETRALHGRALAAWSAWPFPIERPADMLARHAIAAGARDEALRLGHAGVRQLMVKGSLRSAETLIDDLLPLVPAKDERSLCELILSRADIHLRSGRTEEARAGLESLGAIDAIASDDARVRILRLSGAVAESLGDFEGAIRHLEQGQATITESTPVEEQRRLLDRLGLVHYRLGQYDQARSVWEQGLSVGTGEERDLAKSELLNDLGVLDWIHGDLAQAEERHLESLDIRRGLGDLDGESRSLTNLANVAVWRGDLVRGAEFYEESLRLKRLVGTLPAQAVTLRNLANLYLKRGEFGRAITCTEESIQLRELVGERIGEAASRRLLAHLLRIKGEVRRGHEELVKSRSILEELDVRGPDLASSCLAEAEFAMAGGRWLEAQFLAARGLEELGDTANSTMRSELIRCRGQAELEAGDVARSVDSLTKALEEAEKGDDRWELAWNGLALGNALLAREDFLHAHAELNRAMELAREMNTPLLLVEALLGIHDLEEATGQGDQASGPLSEAERLSARLAVPATQLRVWHRMGQRSRRCGFAARAVLWWRKGAKLVQELQLEYEEAQQSAWLAHGDVAAIVASLKEALEEGEVSRTASVEDLIALFDVRGERSPASGKSSSLQPEVLSRLLQISSAVNSMVHREEIMSYLSKRLEELFEAEDSKIILVGRDGGFRLMGESERDSELEISRTVLDRVMTQGGPVLIQDTSHDAELVDRKSVHRLGLVSILCAPLVVDGETIGIIQFSHRSKAGPFGEEDLKVLELFAHQAATALKNMLLVEQLDETIERLRSSEAKLVAGERLRALGEMSAGVAHDFNNLLTIILGITGLMRSSGDISEELRRDIETLETVSETAAATVRRLQEFRGQSHRNSKLFDPAEVVRVSAELGRRRFTDDKNHHITLELSEVPRVRGHESELREVVMNLVINAIEAMQDGGHLCLRTYTENGQAVIECQDDGPGMPGHVAQRVFDPFFSTKVTGQGMGLAVSCGIVRRMEGTITVEPGVERGTLFRVRLPGASSEPEELVPSLASQGRRSSSRVLVVDDDPVVREVVCRMLMSAGFQAVGCYSGREALAVFETEPFQLVLTDYSMPHMDGTELGLNIKSLAPSCPVVLLTGLSPSSIDMHTPTVAGLESATPFDMVLRKPITSQKLAEALHLCASERAGR